MQHLAVDADFLRLRIDARAELGDHLAIDFHAAVEDQLLALAAAGDAGGGEHFLQPLAPFLMRHGIRRASQVDAWRGGCGRAGIWIRFVARDASAGDLGMPPIIGCQATAVPGGADYRRDASDLIRRANSSAWRARS